MKSSEERVLGSLTLDGVMSQRLNQEPLIFKGLTSSELNLLFFGALVFWLPVCVAIGLAIDYLTVMIGVTFGLSLVTVFLGASHFQRVKRNRPDGFYGQRIAIALHKTGLRDSGFDLPDGRLALGRTNWPRVS